MSKSIIRSRLAWCLSPWWLVTCLISLLVLSLCVFLGFVWYWTVGAIKVRVWVWVWDMVRIRVRAPLVYNIFNSSIIYFSLVVSRLK